MGVMLPSDLKPEAPEGSAQPAPTSQGMEHLSVLGKRYFKLIEFDDEERLVQEIRKHVFGLVLIVITGIFVMIATVAVTIALSIASQDNSLQTTGASGFGSLIILIGFFLTVLEGLAMFIGIYLYRSNVVFITNQKIAQVLYTNIFNRKISQLNMGDVQDVTVTQKGLPAHLFNYGTLVVETAGEQQNYTFTYVPKPYEATKTIIGLHEKNISKYGN